MTTQQQTNSKPAVIPPMPDNAMVQQQPQQMQAQQQGAAPAAPKPAAQALVEYVNGQVVKVGFDTAPGFAALQRVANLWAHSALVPDNYKENLPDCAIAIDVAMRIGANPLMVMQNLYIVHGRPSWSSQFAIAAFNNCGRFHPIKYRMTGAKGKPEWGCVAYAKEKDTGEIVEGPEVSMYMAKAEGWSEKKGSKWLTMPELMLRYRSAAFLIRTTAPDLLMGLRTQEESEDIGEIPEEVLAPKGVAGLKSLLPPSETTETPHDQKTGEVLPQSAAAPAADAQPKQEEKKPDAEPAKSEPAKK